MQEPFNISLYPGSGTMDGHRGDHVIVAPAYNVTEDEIREIVDRTARVVKRFFHRYVQRFQRAETFALGVGTATNRTFNATSSILAGLNQPHVENGDEPQ